MPRGALDLVARPIPRREPALTIRTATDKDVPALTRLINAAYSALGDMGLNFTGVTQDDAITRDRMRGCEVFVLEVDGRLSSEP